MQAIPSLVSQRISFLRTLLIFGIVVVHVPPHMENITSALSGFDFIKHLFAESLFRTAVPMLTCISGYLFFQNLERFSYRKSVTKKAKRILFPFLLWNLSVVALLYCVERFAPGAHEFRIALYPLEWRSLADAAFALTDAPANYPLDFLRDLFLLFLISPAFVWMMRTAAWLSLALISFVFLNNYDGFLILRDSMPICFFFGGMAATKGWDMTRLDRYWPAAVGVLIVYVLYNTIALPENFGWTRIIAPLFIWPAVSAWSRSSFGAYLARFGNDVFIVFLSHGMVLLVVYMLYEKWGGAVPYPLFWLVTPFALFGGILAGFRWARRHLPRVAKVAIGEI